MIPGDGTVISGDGTVIPGGTANPGDGTVNPDGTVIRPWSLVRTPSFWILLGVTGIATAVTLFTAVFFVILAPWSTLVGALLVTVYVALFLLAIRQFDRLGTRPWWLVALAGLWGATVSVLVGGAAGFTMDNLLGRLFSPELAGIWGAMIVAPPAEELAKVAGVVFLFLAARPYLRTVFAGAVYGAIVGVGFAAVEDLGYAALAADDTLPDDVGEALRMLVLRFTLPGAVGHPLFTAVAGAGVAYLLVRTDRTRARRVGVFVGAQALAWLTHAAVNSPVAAVVSDVLDQLPGFAELTGYLLVVGIPGAVSFYWLAALRRADAAQLAERLGAAGPELATADEATAVRTLGGRGRAARAVGRAHGWRAAWAALRVQRAQLRLVDLPPQPPVVPQPIGYAVAPPHPWPTRHPWPPPYPQAAPHPWPVPDPRSAPYPYPWPAPYPPAPWPGLPLAPSPVLPIPPALPAQPPVPPVPPAPVAQPAPLPPAVPAVPAVTPTSAVPPAVTVPAQGAPPMPPQWGAAPPWMPPPQWGPPPPWAGVPGQVPAYGGAPVQPSRRVPKATAVQRRTAELAQARTGLEGLTGARSVPAAGAVSVPAPSWLTRTTIGLSVVGLAAWPAVAVAGLLVAAPLVEAVRRHRPIDRKVRLAALAVLVSGYCWLASVLALRLFPDVI
ncbi:PrsW family intramembrane metalloprotease [Micromonospora sp. NPDC049523]|uniref:PrsW family intramembrane metalloprotease n=1 Tax=Micromonospora sp. NPDC049523 TaxID=3155921 RepID=UPI00344A8953